MDWPGGYFSGGPPAGTRYRRLRVASPTMCLRQPPPSPPDKKVSPKPPWVEPSPADILRILVATDLHLGAFEKHRLGGPSLCLPAPGCGVRIPWLATTGGV